jgi:hypothetical protein
LHIPGFAHLSADTTVETQVVFLEEAKRLVEEMALKLATGESSLATLTANI